jgi:hypothetical protein
VNDLGVTIWALVAGLLLFSLPASSQTFPSASGWVVVTNDGVAVTDPLRDATNSRDIVGDADNPAAYVARDATHIFFRLRVSADPKQNASNFSPFGWGVALDTDQNTDHFEFLIMLNGVNNPDDVSLAENTEPGTNGDARDVAEDDLDVYSEPAPARADPAGTNFDTDADWFVSWAIPISALSAAGVALNTPVRLIFGTSNSAHTLAADLLAADDSELISEIISDPVNCTGGSCTSCQAACGESCEVCSGATPVCDTEIGECIAAPSCEDDSDCSGAVPACQPSEVCGECSLSNQTRCTGSEPVCNVGSGICEGCEVDGDCDDPEFPACLPSGACAECSAGNDALCSDDEPVCDTTVGSCTGCADDSDCEEDPDFPACQPDGSCGECSETNDNLCVDQTPVCDTEGGTCTGCSDDDDCPGLTAPACQEDGSCGECSSTNDDLCVLTTPICSAPRTTRRCALEPRPFATPRTAFASAATRTRTARTPPRRCAARTARAASVPRSNRSSART